MNAERLLRQATEHVMAIKGPTHRGDTFLQLAEWYRSAGLDPGELFARAREAFRTETVAGTFRRSGLRKIKNAKRRRRSKPIPFADEEHFDEQISFPFVEGSVVALRMAVQSFVRDSQRSANIDERLEFTDAKVEVLEDNVHIVMASAKTIAALRILLRQRGGHARM